MKQVLKQIISVLTTLALVWVFLSVLFSFTWGKETCYKDYPIKHIIYTDLLCEIKSDDYLTMDEIIRLAVT